MTQPPQKDWLDVAIDFFYGALAGDILVLLIYARAARNYSFHWNGHTFLIWMVASTLVAGSLAALYRNQFWNSDGTYSIIPPMEERISKGKKTLLWILFVLGWLSLGFFFI